MKLLKCDRCGKIYERYDRKAIICIDEVTKNGRNIELTPQSCAKDLCRKCTEELMNWFKQEE